MLGYPYIAQLFKTILENSLVMQGRFFVCPKWGAELANPSIDEQVAIGQAQANKYPAALLMPPPKEGHFEYAGRPEQSGTSLLDIYTIRMLFVAQSQTSGAHQVLQPNGIDESTHSVPDTWHDMDRAAQNFLSVLHAKLSGVANVIFWDEAMPKITLVPNIGNDEVCGVMLSFKLAIYSGCTIEDYAEGWDTNIVLPAQVDTHPIHKI